MSLEDLSAKVAVVPGVDGGDVPVTRKRRGSKDLLGTSVFDMKNVQITEDDEESPALKKDEEKQVVEVAAFKPGVKLMPSRTSREVTITNQSLDDADADAIVDLIKEGNAKKLVLAQNNLGPQAAAKIAACLESNKTLETLSLHSNVLGDRGAQSFAKLLQSSNTTLTSLYLSDNNFSQGAISMLRSTNDARAKPLAGLTGLVL